MHKIYIREQLINYNEIKSAGPHSVHPSILKGKEINETQRIQRNEEELT